MSGGVGFTQYATAAYTDNILDDYTYYGMDYVKYKYGGAGKVPCKQEAVNDLATEVTLYGMEQYEQYPTALETHFGGSQRASVLAAAAGLSPVNRYRELECRSERLVHVDAPAQGRMVTSRLLRLRPAGPVRFQRTQSPSGRRGLYRRTPWTKLPELRNERRSPGRVRRNRRCCSLWTQDAWTLSPLIKIMFRRPLAEVRLLRITQRVRKGCNPRVHARRRALTDHTSKVRSIQTFFSFIFV